MADADRLFATSIRCPPRTYRRIERYARKQGCSISFKIVEILDEWLDKQARDNKAAAEKIEGGLEQ